MQHTSETHQNGFPSPVLQSRDHTDNSPSDQDLASLASGFETPSTQPTGLPRIETSNVSNPESHAGNLSTAYPSTPDSINDTPVLITPHMTMSTTSFPNKMTLKSSPSRQPSSTSATLSNGALASIYNRPSPLMATGAAGFNEQDEVYGLGIGMAKFKSEAAETNTGVVGV